MDERNNSDKGGHQDLQVNERPRDMEERRFIVDIFEQKRKMRVVAEIPGVYEEDIRLDLYEDILSMSASRGNQNYYRDIALPRACESIIGKVYNTGILEVTLG